VSGRATLPRLSFASESDCDRACRLDPVVIFQGFNIFTYNFSGYQKFIPTLPASEPAAFKQLDIDYYQGAYGATLRLATDEIEDLRTLNAVFRSVRGDRTIDLGSWPGTRSENVQRILLWNAAGRSEIRRAGAVSAMESFEWIQNGEGWRD
jgi:hypothetical protein